MSPAIFRWREYRIHFYSDEEERMHIHATAGRKEAKIWIEPDVELAYNKGVPEREVRELLQIVEEHADAIRHAWNDHFRREGD